MSGDDHPPLEPIAEPPLHPSACGGVRKRGGRAPAPRRRGNGTGPARGRGSRGTRPAPPPPSPASTPAPGRGHILHDRRGKDLAMMAEVVRSRQRIKTRRVAERGLRRGDTEHPDRVQAEDFHAATYEGEGPINAIPHHMVMDVRMGSSLATHLDTQPQEPLLPPRDHPDMKYSDHDSEDLSDPDIPPTTLHVSSQESTHFSPPPSTTPLSADPSSPTRQSSSAPPPPRASVVAAPPSSTTPPPPHPSARLVPPPTVPLPVPAYIPPHRGRAPRRRQSRRDRPVLSPAPTPIDPECLTDEEILHAQWMPGGPRFGTILTSYPTHIARYLWDPVGITMVRESLRSHFQTLHFLPLHRYAAPGPDTWWGIAHRSGLTDVGTLRYGEIDHILIAAFVERWYPETNSFHFPWGEITITLHDVAMLLGLSIDGLEIAQQDDWTDSDLRVKICEMFDITMDQMYDYSGHAGINARHVREFIEAMVQDPEKAPADIASAYLFLLLGCTIFCDRSTNKVKHKYMQLVLDHDRTNKFAWGAGVLALLYRNLGEASRAHTAGIAGCVRLLQSWIWKYFPRFGGSTSLNPQRTRDSCAATGDNLGPIQSHDVDRLIQLRRTLDTLTVEEVQWMPWREGDRPQEVNFRTTHRLSRLDGILRCMDVQEPYYATRVLRQFGLRQVPPLHPFIPSHVNRQVNLSDYKVEFIGDEYPTWEERESHLFDIDAYQRCRWSWECDEQYMDYFLDITHPYVDPSSEPQPVPRPPAVDIDVRLQLALESIRQRVESPGVGDDEREYLNSVLGLLAGKPHPLPNPSQRESRFQKSQHELGEGSSS